MSFKTDFKGYGLCPRVDTCPQFNVSSGNFHWTQAGPDFKWTNHYTLLFFLFLNFFSKVGEVYIWGWHKTDQSLQSIPLKKKKKKRERYNFSLEVHIKQNGCSLLLQCYVRYFPFSSIIMRFSVDMWKGLRSSAIYI